MGKGRLPLSCVNLHKKNPTKNTSAVGREDIQGFNFSTASKEPISTASFWIHLDQWFHHHHDPASGRAAVNHFDQYPWRANGSEILALSLHLQGAHRRSRCHHCWHQFWETSDPNLAGLPRHPHPFPWPWSSHLAFAVQQRCQPPPHHAKVSRFVKFYKPCFANISEISLCWGMTSLSYSLTVSCWLSSGTATTKFNTPKTMVRWEPTKIPVATQGSCSISGTATSPQLSPETTVLKMRRFAFRTDPKEFSQNWQSCRIEQK